MSVDYNSLIFALLMHLYVEKLALVAGRKTFNTHTRRLTLTGGVNSINRTPGVISNGLLRSPTYATYLCCIQHHWRKYIKISKFSTRHRHTPSSEGAEFNSNLSCSASTLMLERDVWRIENRWCKKKLLHFSLLGDWTFRALESQVEYFFAFAQNDRVGENVH